MLSAAAAAAAGAWTVSQIPPERLRPLVLVLLVAICGYTLATRNFGVASQPGSPRSPAPFCTGVGFYDGFLPGAGSFLVFGLVKWFRRGFLQAAAETKAINLATNTGALAFFLAAGAVDLRLGVTMAVANVLGGYAGAATAVRHGAPFVRHVFLLVTVALIGKVAWDLLR